MQTIISDDVRAIPAIHGSVARANEVLLKAIGRAPEPPEAIWRLTSPAQNNPAVELELQYHDESVKQAYPIDRFGDELDLRYRFGRQWEDLLLRANRRTTNRLLDILREWRHETELQ